MSNYYFSGIGGIGMSSLAQIVKAGGDDVCGSDRNYDRVPDSSVFNKLKKQGIQMVPQDGSQINTKLNNLVVSSAIEDNNPDVSAAKDLDIPIIKRAELLADIFNSKKGIAIGGSNGKTSVTAMVGWILDCAKIDPTIMVGGFMKNYESESVLGNARTGESEFIVIEADESDKSILNYRAGLSVINGISKDHMTIDELSCLFEQFCENTEGVVILNTDCPLTSKLKEKFRNNIGYGISEPTEMFAEDIKLYEWGSIFCLEGSKFKINVPGRFNVLNAVAAITVAKCMDVEDDDIAGALETYSGVRWRMDLVGVTKNVTVIYDYAHNPAKIKASIEAVKVSKQNIIVIFQPHGFGPTRFLKNELIESFGSMLLSSDLLIMPEIYYAGGTVNVDISSKDIIDVLKGSGINALYFKERAKIADYLKEIVHSYDIVLVMGARDYTLMDFSNEIFDAIKTS